MNEVHGYVKQVGSKYQPMLRTMRDGESKPILAPGGKPYAFKTREKALEMALEHVCAYINGKEYRQGEVAPMEPTEREKVFGSKGVIIKKGRAIQVERVKAA